MSTKAELLSKVEELETRLKDAEKPRLAIDRKEWAFGYEDLSITPFDFDEDLHPDVREYKRTKHLLEEARASRDLAMESFNKVADLLDDAVLAILRSDSDDDDKVVDRYRELMNSLRGTLR